MQVEERLKNSRVGRRGSPNEVLQLHVNTHHSLGETSSDGQGFCDGSVQAGLTLTGFKKGSALLIWNQLTDGQTPDASAAHLVCPGNSQVGAQGRVGVVRQLCGGLGAEGERGGICSQLLDARQRILAWGGGWVSVPVGCCLVGMRRGCTVSWTADASAAHLGLLWELSLVGGLGVFV